MNNKGCGILFAFFSVFLPLASEAKDFDRFYIAPGYMTLKPDINSDRAQINTDVTLSNVLGFGELVFEDVSFEIPNSYIAFGPFDGLGGILGYRVTEHISIETVLAIPQPIEIALNLPDAVMQVADVLQLLTVMDLENLDPGEIYLPDVNQNVGELDMLGMILGSNYRIPLHKNVSSYVGGGLVYLTVDDAQLNSISVVNFENASLSVNDRWGYYMQLGTEVFFSEHWSVLVDVKSLSVETSARIENVTLDGGSGVELAPGVIDIDFSFKGVIYHIGLNWAF
ncbi:MAG: outer membrane beta-barrel protein [Gammaproteobacteria bacterium]|nr:outer membrane beta-barrel protein [Gammaproteobacteria bacterium]